MGPKTKSLCLWTLCLTIFLSPATNGSAITKKLEELSWVKFCRGPHKKLIHTQECTKGIEFPKEVPLDCICAKGVWAAFSDPCDAGNSFSVIYGTGNCFRLNEKVTRLINMGSPRTNHFPSVYFIGKTGPSSHSTYITERANPSLAEEFIQNAFEQKRPKKSVSDFFFQTLVCEKQLKKLEQESPASLLVYRLPNATMIMSRFHPLHCDRRLQEVGPYRLSPGHAFFGNAEASLKLPKCSIRCAGHAAHNRPHAIAKRAIAKYRPIVMNKTEEDLTREGLLNSKQNEATAIILRQNNAFLLFGVQESLNVSQNWIVVQKANKIVKTACPNLDPMLQNSMVRMFRFLYAYFKDGRHAPKEFLESDIRLTRIKDTLEKCSKDAKKIEFKYGPPGACEKNKTIVEATIIGKTLAATGDDMRLPEKEAYSKELHDVVIEAVWKMISFVHYFCAEYFADAPFDYSALTQMYTGFLGEDIVYRWHNPEVANNGIYSAFNTKLMLDKYIQGLDVCVAIAKKIAAYPTWIDRPDLGVAPSSAPRSRRNKRVKRESAPHLMNKCLRNSDMTDGRMEVCTSELN